MKKFYIVSFSHKRISSLLSSILLSLSIIALNFFYFTNINSESIFSSNFFGLIAQEPAAISNNGGKLAIIIDDFGQNRNGVKEMMSIDRHLTFAVMPFLAHSQTDAHAAYEKGYEIIVHLPMESYNGKLSWVGPKPILSAMSDDEVQQLVEESFESIPHAVGANIHMGAKAGGDERIISDVLEIIKEKGVYFVDSRATTRPVAKKLADSVGVLCFDRDVFLDGKKTKAYIKSQLKKSCDIALKKGKAVAIGHVGTEGGKVTAEAIMEMLPEFDSKNIQLVFISELEK